ncbi:hypothetical protein ACE193_14490 [Bernardetia sp. OM2101]|uniref:hypothetical protein n=1 Tax=Bernardetia sp. OM2101 TaxID=3344876 RepID=UPI0035D04D5B
METIRHQIKQLILKFESKETPLDFTLKEINAISTIKIDEYDLQNYWISKDLEGFIDEITIAQIIDWQEIDDNQAHKLITEIKNNINDSSIVNRNTTALEKRYSKPKGTISDWIFYDDITDSEQILKLLKKDTIIRL